MMDTDKARLTFKEKLNELIVEAMTNEVAKADIQEVLMEANRDVVFGNLKAKD